MVCLVPIGVVAFSRGVKFAWLTALTAAIMYCFFLLGVAFFMGQRDFLHLATSATFLWSCASIVLILCVFTWIVAPPIPVPSTALRLIIGGAIILAAFVIGFRMGSDTDGLYEFMTAQIKALYGDLGLGDQWDASLVVRNILAVTARGGGLAMAVLFLFVNRQIGIAISAIAIKKKPIGRGMIYFFVPPVIVWILSSSLLSVIIFTKFMPILSLEIAAWNVVTMCTLFYIAQGLGIVLYFLSRPGRSAWFRMAMTFLIVILIMSPGINLVTLGVVLSLGIAENWVTFRNFDKTSSTPVV